MPDILHVQKLQSMDCQRQNKIMISVYIIDKQLYDKNSCFLRFTEFAHCDETLLDSGHSQNKWCTVADLKEKANEQPALLIIALNKHCIPLHSNRTCLLQKKEK